MDNLRGSLRILLLVGAEDFSWLVEAILVIAIFSLYIALDFYFLPS